MQVSNYADATAPALEFLRTWAAKGEVLLLAATRAAADDLVRSACGDAIAGVHRFTLREYTIAASSERMNQQELSPVRQVGREALAALVTSRALRADALQYFRGVAGFPGFPRALARTLERLRLNRIRAGMLRTIAPDLAILMELYEEELQNRLLADHSARVEFAIESIAGLPGMPVLMLDVEPDGTAEADLITAIAERSSAVLRIELGTSDTEPQNELASLQQYVLSGETAPPRMPDGSFGIFSASGEALECAEIARHILLAARDGIAFDATAVLLREPEKYQPLVAEALRRGRIPAYFSRGTRAPDPAGRALLALLRCAEENYSATRFAEYLSLGQMPVDERGVRSPIAWERLLVDAAVIGGKERWKRRIEGLIEARLAQHDASVEAGIRAWCARQVEMLEGLGAFAVPLIGKLEALPKSGTWAGWNDALTDLATVALKNPEGVLEFLEELSPMADVGPVSLTEVLLVLQERLTNLRGETQNDRYGKVFVGAISEARAMSFRCVFIPAVNEGVFPRLIAEDPLLLDSQCRALGMETSRDDAKLLKIAAASASERVVLSWSRLDLLTGRAKVPSFYAFEALRAARGTEVEVREFEEEARSATETRTGWPAPSDFATAIDDLEFDLAYLRSAWEQRTRGEGAYLTKLNPHAVRSLRARWVRWRKPWKWADGLVDLDMHAIQVLDEHRPSKRAWSASALQQFARCPYRFALKGILGLERQDRPEAVQRVDPVTRGRIYHEVQFRLLRELKQAGRPLSNSEVLATLSSLIDQVDREYRQRLAPAIPQVWDADIESIHADLRGWVQHKTTLDADWTPLLFEYAFGVPEPEKHDEASLAKPVEALPGVFLRGSVDLVEENANGILRVVDHKTGRVPAARIEAVGGGEHLQPLLYALAVEQALDRKVSGGRLFYSTLRQNYRTVDVALHDGSRARVGQVLATIDNALHNGFLPAAPRKDGCKGCEFTVVCGPWEEERVARKSTPELRPLQDVRRLP